MNNIFFHPLFLLLIAWSLYWKGRALWKSARNAQKGWFVALLIINTAGILEIIYLFSSWSRPKLEQGETGQQST